MVVAALALLAQGPAFEFDVASQTGLTIRAGGIPVVRGSWFQFYEPDWSRGYYSSTYQRQTIEREGADTVRLTFSASTGASGTHTYTRTGNQLKARFEFRWAGEKPVRVEVTPGMVWAPAFGRATLDGQPSASLGRDGLTDLASRRLGLNAKSLAFEGPAVRLGVAADSPLLAFDARGYDQEFARNRDLLWVGVQDLEVSRERPAVLEVNWTLEPLALRTPSPTPIRLAAQPLKESQRPNADRRPLVPRPKTVQLNWNKPLHVSGSYSYPAGLFRRRDEFFTALGRRWRVPAPAGDPIAFDGGEGRMGLKPGGYRIIVSDSPRRISVVGQDDAGLRFGLRRLAALTFAKDGKLWLPTGTIVDEPVNPWRGVHLFVGPTALGFHERLWNRALLDLGFNRVVLQCERTDWESVPGIRTAITMPRAQLGQLFDRYRSWGVEPIPLVQSFGHMEWLFANGQNRDLALNPNALYAVDPRVPRTATVLNDLWDEVVRVTKASTLHFGLDEVDMIGWPDDPELVTSLWERQMPVLADIAKRHGKRMMLWGDMALAPNEAIDATNGENADHAQRRRRAIPQGAWIADWHYRADERPETFEKNLNVWRESGFTPVASTWYRPENIRGFALAANRLGSGVLQTTWAGYESNETNMVREFQQFSAMAIMADYAWSGRTDLVRELGYDANALFRELYFGLPSPLMPEGGVSLGAGETFEIGRYGFRRFAPISVGSRVEGDTPVTRTIPVGASARLLILAADTLIRADEGALVAEVTVVTGANRTTVPLLYGGHVRAANDARPTAAMERRGSLAAITIPLAAGQRVDRIEVRPVDGLAGLRVHGITLVQ